MTRRVKLDWAKVKAILAPQDFTIVNEQRARHMELNRILSTPLPKIDFEMYRQTLSNQSVVSQTEQAVQGFRPAKGDVSQVLQSLNEQQSAAVQKAKETVDQVLDTVSGFKKELDGIKAMQKPDYLTPDVVYGSTPGLEKVYFDRLRQGKTYHDDHNFGEKFFG